MADYRHDSVFNYREFFSKQERSEDMEAIRDAAFPERLVSKLGKVVVPRKRVRPKKEDE